MPTDQTTFLLAFLGIFAGIALYVLRLRRLGRSLKQRLAAAELAARANKPQQPGEQQP